jgi:hypothetical protein
MVPSNNTITYPTTPGAFTQAEVTNYTTTAWKELP